MFKTEKDFAAFERVLAEAVQRSAGEIELLAYCVMGNHWHLVLRVLPDCHGAMGRFMKWLTTTHAGRYRVAHGQGGIGHLYQGRYKSFLVNDDAHLLTVCRYVERNAARASMVVRAEDWQWSSLWRWRNPHTDVDEKIKLNLSPWPITSDASHAAAGSGRPRNWLRTVNTPLSEDELTALRLAANRCRPYGSSDWVNRMVTEFNLESTMRNPGRPKKQDS
jgi:putative transposase